MDAQTKENSQWTTKRLLRWTADYFTQVHLDQPRLSAEILLAHVLNCQRIDLYVQFDRCLEQQQLADFRTRVKRAADHEPVAYITGKAHFYSLMFEVTPDVLIPRPETEILVAQAIDFCRRHTTRPTVEVLDLCTGSGCIAVALAANVIETEIIALDRSPAALQVARKNLQTHDLQSRITLLESDLFSNMDQAAKALFDLIVANPPYISDPEYQKLPPHITDYEPKDALRAGPDGLDVIRRIIEQAEPYLADNAALMLEIAYDQAEQIIALCRDSGYLKDTNTVVDNLGYKRVITARKA